MALEIERCDSGSNGSRDWSRFGKALSEPKQGSDVLYSRDVVTLPKHRRRGCSSPNLRTGHLKMLESLEEALDPTLQLCDVCQLLRVWLSKTGKGTWDMAAHLRNRRTPRTWVTCGELGVTAPE